MLKVKDPPPSLARDAALSSQMRLAQVGLDAFHVAEATVCVTDD